MTFNVRDYTITITATSTLADSTEKATRFLLADLACLAWDAAHCNSLQYPAIAEEDREFAEAFHDALATMQEKARKEETA